MKLWEAVSRVIVTTHKTEPAKTILLWCENAKVVQKLKSPRAPKVSKKSRN